MNTIAQVGNARSPIIQSWAEFMVSQGFDTHLISEERYDGERLSDVTIHYIGDEHRQTPALNYLRKVRQTKRILKEIDADVAHAHYVYGYGLLLALGKFHPFVATAMGNDIGMSTIDSTLINRGTKYVLKKADIISVKDSNARRRAIELGCDPEKIRVHKSTCDTKVFNKEAKNPGIREELGIGDSPMIMYTRPISLEYHSEEILKAIPTVIKRIPNAHFVMVKKRDWATLPSATLHGSKMIRYSKAVLDGNVIWVDPIPHPDKMAEYLATADLLVDTYYPRVDVGGHGHGTNFVEAMACGCPQVVPDRREFVLGTSAGWCHSKMYSKGNPEDLAEKIIHVLSDDNMRKWMGEQSIMSAQREFDQNVVMGDMVEVYESIQRN